MLRYPLFPLVPVTQAEGTSGQTGCQPFTISTLARCEEEDAAGESFSAGPALTGLAGYSQTAAHKHPEQRAS